MAKPSAWRGQGKEDADTPALLVQCPHCSARFTNDTALDRHERIMHATATDIRKVACLQCGQIYCECADVPVL